MNNPVAELVRSLLSSNWFLVLGCLVGAVYLAALLWKILRSEEGFLFGYRDWVIGKWQRNQSDSDSQHTAVHRHGENESGGSPRRRSSTTLERDLHVKGSVLKLSRLLDGDLAYLMSNPADQWDAKIMRALQTIVSGVTRVVRPVGRCRCGFFILDDDAQYLVLVVGEGYLGPQRPRLAVEHSCAGRAFVTGENYYCRDIAIDPVYWHSARGRRDFRSIACCPVRAGNAIYGVVCLDASDPGAFTPDDFEHLETFSAKIAVFCAFHALQDAGVCELPS